MAATGRPSTATAWVAATATAKVVVTVAAVLALALAVALAVALAEVEETGVVMEVRLLHSPPGCTLNAWLDARCLPMIDPRAVSSAFV